MKIVLLPGLDGTGQLFSRFIEEIPKHYSVQVIKYPSNERLNYQDLTTLVLKQLPSDDFILLAESFSGPIAFMLALAKPKYLQSIIFVATFLTPPRPTLLMLSSLMPVETFLSLPIPNFVIKNFLMGNLIDKQAIQQFKSTIKMSSSKTLSYRLQIVKQLELDLKLIQYPVVYLQALQDVLVPNDSVRPFKKYCENLTILKIKGPHLILQAQPQQCARMLFDEINHST